MTIDRSKLEEAIKTIRSGSTHPLFTQQAELVLRAAEACAEMLPKPAWRVRLHRGNTFELYSFETPEGAIARVAASLTGAYDKVEIEAP